MNTTAHTIRAIYTTDGTEWHEVDTNGEGFAGVVEGMLDFWNDADNRAGVFTISGTFRPDYFTTVVEIIGKVYGYRDGEVATDIVDTVTVHVIAVER